MNVLRVILTVYFGSSLIKGASLLFRSESMDLLLFESVGAGWLFWLLLLATLAAEVVALVYLWRPFATGYRIAQAAVIVDFLESTIAGLI